MKRERHRFHAPSIKSPICRLATSFGREKSFPLLTNFMLLLENDKHRSLAIERFNVVFSSLCSIINKKRCIIKSSWTFWSPSSGEIGFTHGVANLKAVAALHGALRMGYGLVWSGWGVQVHSFNNSTTKLNRAW